jgi:hypothetical protein
MEEARRTADAQAMSFPTSSLKSARAGACMAFARGHLICTDGQVHAPQAEERRLIPGPTVEWPGTGPLRQQPTGSRPTSTPFPCPPL